MMGQEDNDLKQLKQCRKDLSNVYKSQVNDEIMDNGNISNLNKAILCLQDVIKWLKEQPEQPE